MKRNYFFACVVWLPVYAEKTTLINSLHLSAVAGTEKDAFLMPFNKSSVNTGELCPWNTGTPKHLAMLQEQMLMLFHHSTKEFCILLNQMLQMMEKSKSQNSVYLKLKSGLEAILLSVAITIPSQRNRLSLKHTELFFSIQTIHRLSQSKKRILTLLNAVLLYTSFLLPL